MKAAKVLLDTNVLISLEKGLSLAKVIDPDDDVAVSVVTIGELQLGVERSDDAHRRQRSAFVQRMMQHLPSIDYTLQVALVHAKIAATMSGKGLTSSRPDLMIAATAIATGRTLVTADEGFSVISGLKARRPMR
ncbi:PIN domain-containing protein [Nonomuraea sp. NPDC050680]|uniref:PIN domain-containing protein n=1 Tax=Nonomuraea sp. NPDC050680 TaxID=3154630 RepID=UPI0033D53AB5